jgi:hypothetical protein
MLPDGVDQLTVAVISPCNSCTVILSGHLITGSSVVVDSGSVVVVADGSVLQVVMVEILVVDASNLTIFTGKENLL